MNALNDRIPANRKNRPRKDPADKSGRTLIAERKQVKSLDELLREHGLSLDVLRRHADLAASGDPQLPGALLALYRFELLRVSPDSAKTYLAHLRGGLTSDGWDLSGCGWTDGKDGLNFRIAEFHTQQREAAGQSVRPSRARPLLPDDINALLNVLDEYRTGSLILDEWIDQWSDLLVIWFWLAARVTEITVLMSWKWIDGIDTDRVEVNFPAGLKHQADDAPLTLDRTQNPRLDPVLALRRRRDAVQRLGIPHGPHDRVFVDFRRLDPHYNTSPPAVARKFGDRLWLDTVTEFILNDEWLPEEDERVRVALAVQNASSKFQRELTDLCAEAGIESRSITERVSSHGVRGGFSTALDRAGASAEVIRLRLRHRNMEAQQFYVNRGDSPATNLQSLVPLQD